MVTKLMSDVRGAAEIVLEMLVKGRPIGSPLPSRETIINFVSNDLGIESHELSTNLGKLTLIYLEKNNTSELEAAGYMSHRHFYHDGTRRSETRLIHGQ